MKNKTIFSVNTEVPVDDVLEIDYRSNQTLLDAEIILFTPSLNYYESDHSAFYGSSMVQGKRCLSQNSSFKALEQNRHWKNEIAAAANSGKLVVVYLVVPDECFRHTGEKKSSGTGRNQTVTNFVTEISSYDAIPFIANYSIKTGTKTRIIEAGSVIAPYWDEFSKYSPYKVEIVGEFSDIVLESEVGRRVVGALKKYDGGGAILFLPPVNFDNPEFVKKKASEYVWTNAAFQAGKRFLVAICNIAAAISVDRTVTQPPIWTLSDNFRLPSEDDIETQIIQVSEELTRLEETMSLLQQNLIVTGAPRKLLFEKGAPLECAILESLKLMGFDANGFDDGKSEFDAVFVAAEGRFVGEAEGRDNKAIGIDKFSQLERNLHEDFNRDEIEDIAKGVLFGNGFRLTNFEERTEIFTKKCLDAAKRTGIALVRTPDMFEPTRYLFEHPEDNGYAEECRKAIADANGRIVKFPSTPNSNLSRHKERVSVVDESKK